MLRSRFPLTIHDIYKTVHFKISFLIDLENFKKCIILLNKKKKKMHNSPEMSSDIFESLKFPSLFAVKSFFFFLIFLGAHLQHMEVPRLGVKSEL